MSRWAEPRAAAATVASARPRLGWLATLAAVAFLSVPSASRAADAAIDVSASFIANSIGGAIDGYIEANVSRFAWLNGLSHVETSLSGADDVTLHVLLRLSYEVTIGGRSVNVPVDLDLDLRFECDAGGPSLRLDNLRVTTLVTIPAAVIAEIRTAADRMLVDRTRAIVEPIWNALGTLPPIADVRQVCPHFEIAPNGAIHAELDFVNGCINGRHKHRACGGRFVGDGYDYACVNGRWDLLGGFCEPGAPPGGQRP
jgi:hypothetical protein